MPPGTFEQIAGTGITGALLIVTLFALRAKDNRLSAETAARIEDAKVNLQLAMKLQEQVISAVNKLADVIEIWEKRDAERERERAERERERERSSTRGYRGEANPSRKNDP